MSRKETEKRLEKREQKDRQDEKRIQSVLYFLLGILLSTCITAVSIAYALPKIAVRTESAAVSAVTSELVEDTINASLGDYLSMNKINVSDESMEEITQYISDSVSNQTAVTENELSEVKNLIKVSIQGTNENMNTNIQNTNDNLNVSMTTLQEFVVNGDDEISNALKDYIDKYVVPGISASIEMNTEDIVTVNENIVEMGNEYNLYRETNDTNLSEIISMIEDYRVATEEEIGNTNEKLEVYQEELLEKIDNFHTEYDAYVESTDEKIEDIHQKLDERVTVVEFNEFQEKYEAYKSDMGKTIGKIEDALILLEEKKADKGMVQELAAEFERLESAYDAFTGENGNFSQLTERVTDAEAVNVQNSNDIVALEEKIKQLEQTVAAEDAVNSNNIAALEEKLAKFYQVGSVYITFGNENPAELYGGTWEKVEDTFLMCAGSAYPVGSSGGSNAVTLNVTNIPSLNVAGNTSAKNGVGTSQDGSFSKTINSNGTCAGGTYYTSASGEHNHAFTEGGNALVVHSNSCNPVMLPNRGFSAIDYGNAGYIWFNDTNKNESSIANAGNHNHSVTIPSQNIASAGSISVGNHSHTINIPALSLTGNYTNNNLQSVDVTNKYVAVNVWKRVA